MNRAARATARSPFAGVALCLALSSFSAIARAQVLGRDGDPIRTSRYSVDLTQTPVLASTRVTGLAGAYVAIGEGIDGDVQTPAAPAVRVPYSTDHFDYELGLGLTLPATLTSTDFFNTGRGRTQLSDASQGGFVFVTPALNLAWGEFGLGATLELQNYSLSRNGSPNPNAKEDQFSADFAVVHLQVAHRFLKGDIVVGVGARLLRLDVTNPLAPSGQTEVFTTTGAGFEAGAIWMPAGLPFRVGAAFRSAVTTEPDANSLVTQDASGNRSVGDPSDPFWLPDRVVDPWDLNVGLALQVGPRPFNPRWIDPRDIDVENRRAVDRRTAERAFRRKVALRKLEEEGRLDDVSRRALDSEIANDEAIDDLGLDRSVDVTQTELHERFAALPRRYALISMSLLVTGTVTDAVGVESFLQRVVARSGHELGFSPRLGVETEVVPDWMKARVGTYGEPTRFATSTNRLHATFGFDTKLFPWQVFGLFDEGTEWRISGSLDGAARYFGWGVSIGVWH